ncbi:MAG TPA: hypothetical protein VFQ74_07050 [Pseudolysinimonas sp.]|nr:hypothetical protein [Pseudolysinimonas sp.]
MPMAARAQRLARGWIVGLVATTVAAVSHSLAGGYQPGALSFGTALVFAGLLGTAVVRRTPSLPRLIVAVGVSQLAFHLLFSLLGSGGAAPSTAADAGFGMSGMPGMAVPPTSAPLAMGAHDHLADSGMWIAHAVAAVLTVVFLRRAELAVWTMLTRLGRVLATRLTVVLVPVASDGVPRIPARPSIARRPAERLLVASASRRGPPLLAF